MSERWHLPLAMWRVHFDLLGGSRRGGLIALGYVLAMAVGLYMFRRALPDMSIADFSAGFVNFLIAAQGLILVAGGSTSIYRAMLRDFDLRMLESHRLTPMSNWSVVLGYVTGPTLQILFIAGLNLMVGSLFSLVGNKPLIAWLGGNALMLLGASVFWSFTVFIGLRKAKPLNPTAFLALVGMFAVPTMSIPAIGSFIGIYPIMSGFLIAREDMKIPLGLIATVSIVSMVIVTFWFSLSAAKYRRPDLPALNGLRGLTLLVLWLLLGITGMHIFKASATAIPNPTEFDDPVGIQLLVMVIGAMIIAWVPISGAVECAIVVGRGGSPRNFGDRMRDRNVAMLSAAAIIGLTSLFAATAWRQLISSHAPFDDIRSMNSWARPGSLYGWLPVGLAVLFSASTANGVFRTFYSRAPMQRARAIMILVALTVVPIALDLARVGFAVGEFPNSDFAFSSLIGFSPIGVVLAVLTSSQDLALEMGLCFQAMVAIVFTSVGRRCLRARLRVPVTVPPAT